MSIAINVIVAVSVIAFVSYMAYTLYMSRQRALAKDIKTDIWRWHMSTMDNMIGKMENILRYSSLNSRFITGERQFVEVIKEYRKKSIDNTQGQLRKAGLVTNLCSEVNTHNEHVADDVISRVLGHFITDQNLIGRISRKSVI